MPTSYGTVADATNYHTAHGQATRWGAVADQDAALLRASEYIDQRYRERLPSGRWVSRFPGEPTGGRAQEREWPRTGAVDYDGYEIASATVPDEVERATYEAALLEGESPGSLSPEYVASEQAKSEKVGPIKVEYADTAQSGYGAPTTPNRPVVPQIDEILAPVLVARYDLPAVSVV